MNPTCRKFISLLNQPAALAGMALLALNTLVLQRYAPGWLSGKLGDFAWFVFAPYLLAAGLACLPPLRRPLGGPALALPGTSAHTCPGCWCQGAGVALPTLRAALRAPAGVSRRGAVVRSYNESLHQPRHPHPLAVSPRLRPLELLV